METRFILEPFHRNITDDELIGDLISVSNRLNKKNITSKDYNENGKYKSRTFRRRFGSWQNSLVKAQLISEVDRNITEQILFENIQAVWIKLGRQPKSRDMIKPISKYTVKPYKNRFMTWRKALEQFVLYIDVASDNNLIIGLPNVESDSFRHKTKREPSERLKVQILMRDGNKCKLCGKELIGDEIHFDHIIPWSKNGETILENMQVLCKKHNLAKGNILVN